MPSSNSVLQVAWITAPATDARPPNILGDIKIFHLIPFVDSSDHFEPSFKYKSSKINAHIKGQYPHCTGENGLQAILLLFCREGLKNDHRGLQMVSNESLLCPLIYLGLFFYFTIPKIAQKQLTIFH